MDYADRQVKPLIQALLYALALWCDTLDFEKFRRDRERLMRLTTSLMLKRQNDALRHAPAGWNVPVTLRCFKDPEASSMQLPPPDPNHDFELALFERDLNTRMIRLEGKQALL